MGDERDPPADPRDAVRSTNLKARALDVATAVVSAKGPDAVNLRDLAAALNTGPASLYYHFKNKDALLAEVAAVGFRSLEAAVIAAHEAGPSGAAIRVCGGAYLRFIRERTMLYKLMYAERIQTRHEVARVAEQRAFATFARLIASQGGEPEQEDLRNSALALWALGRGTAALAIPLEETEPGSGRALARQIVSGLEALMGRPVRGGAPPT
jgi:AcrR family transcriptional regulator